MPEPSQTRVLFVCTGNICRSPMAESIFAHLVKSQGLEERYEIDSAGTGGWHVGQKPDLRTIEVLKAHGIPWVSTARQVNRSDFETFDYILAMDQEHLSDLLRMGAPPEKLSMMLSWDRNAKKEEVPDPYYGGPRDFQEVYDLLRPACEGLLAKISD